MAKKTTQTIKIANTEITIGDVIEVTPKRDADAPSGFQAFGTTKLLMKGIKEVRGIFYDDEAEVYDTGFDIDSLCNSNIPKEQRTALVKEYNALIREPYEKKFRKDLDITNDDFWMPFTYEIYTGKTFDTTKPKELLELFLALKQGRVCEVGEKDPTLQRKAKYNIRNNKKVQSLQEERSETKFEAMSTFKVMLDAFDPKKDELLYTILEWIQVSHIRGADKDVLKKAGIKLFDHEKNAYDNSRRFLDAVKLSETDEGSKQMEMYSLITKLYNRNKIEIKRQQYYIDGVLLGNHLKEASAVASKDPEIKKLIVDAIKQLK